MHACTVHLLQLCVLPVAAAYTTCAVRIMLCAAVLHACTVCTASDTVLDGVVSDNLFFDEHSYLRNQYTSLDEMGGNNTSLGKISISESSSPRQGPIKNGFRNIIWNPPRAPELFPESKYFLQLGEETRPEHF